MPLSCPDDLRDRIEEIILSSRTKTRDYADIARERHVSSRQVQRWAKEVRQDIASGSGPESSDDPDFESMVLNARYERVKTELEQALAAGDIKRARRLYAEKREMEDKHFNTWVF